MPPEVRIIFMKRAAIFLLLFSLALASAGTFTLDTRSRPGMPVVTGLPGQQKVLWGKPRRRQ
ncbi:MAG: hypothetical protein Ct9H300mP7_6980 [Verrucomicrobiota bacterium]|nr:MAG: hypothetical protein Ct9H300mP7_6980 [Verrucomicrobiota bacterium]